MGIHVFNPNTWKVEVRTLPRVQGQPVLHSIRLDTATLQNPVSKKPKTNENMRTKENPKDT